MLVVNANAFKHSIMYNNFSLTNPSSDFNSGCQVLLTFREPPWPVRTILEAGDSFKLSLDDDPSSCNRFKSSLMCKSLLSCGIILTICYCANANAGVCSALFQLHNKAQPCIERQTEETIALPAVKAFLHNLLTPIDQSVGKPSA